MPRVCYCHIITDKVNHLLKANFVGNYIFGLDEMEAIQKKKYEEKGHKVKTVKCTTKKPKL